MPLRHSLDALAFRHTTHCSVLIPFREKHSHIFEGIFRCFFTLSERAKTHKASCKKYKPYILKYKALISKYVPCIFCEKRHLIFSDLQNRKNSVFPHRCVRKKSSETECTHPRKPCIVFAEPTGFTHMPLVSPKLPNAVVKTPSDAFKKTSKPYNDFLYFHLLIKTVGIFSAFPENQAK